MDGEWQDYYDNGNIRKIHFYKEGKENGRWIYFKQNGHTRKVEEWSGGFKF